MRGMDASSRRALVALAVVVAILAFLGRGLSQGQSLARSSARAPDTFAVSPEQRAGTFAFGGDLSVADRAWILAAVAKARPEAQRLIGEVDGTVRFGAHHGPEVGEAIMNGTHATIELNLSLLDGERTQDRDVTVVHELGHVVDFQLIPTDLNRRLDAGIPRSGVCGEILDHATGGCTAPEERFADTFAKWALRGSVSVVGAGYGVPVPPSLEDWGAPLVTLSNEIAARG
jgi:hypothetical protein